MGMATTSRTRARRSGVFVPFLKEGTAETVLRFVMFVWRQILSPSLLTSPPPGACPKHSSWSHHGAPSEAPPHYSEPPFLPSPLPPCAPSATPTI
ncbi:hypothetical protein KC19_VG236900 [Ceratodon purpureus]|uniref:Uncharacterized protein n=1 Tax=Ceratodon purpureus TaxID=3225 RepID=A0A8T0HT57_CERPU|nr:hypothetical protein KC19_VG236900 [Ceratodon purpureus]